MKSKDLLSHLSLLEAKLSDFSFEELTSNEASLLKKSFLSFKINLEEKVLSEKVPLSVPPNTGFSKKIADITDNKVEKIASHRPHESESKLIANVSHEIRTPLNGIVGFTNLLKESKLTEEQQGQVDAIQSASHTLMDIINELLEYSKLSAGQEKLESVDFNFFSMVSDLMYLCNTLILNKNVELKADIDPSIPEILVGDPSKLSQILLNLLGNAIKFVEKGKIHLKITRKKKKGRKVLLEFEISDTGIGISEVGLKHIFDPFKQAESDTFSKYGGSGLGLSIVKQIIGNLGGNITVSSTLGTGTTFKFLLPFKESAHHTFPKKKKIPSATANKKEIVKGMRILVFEDNLLNQKLIEQRLKLWECPAYITDNALYGLDFLENNRIDLVLMDLRMPMMNGFQVTQRIRSSKNAHVNQIPIIVLTADFTIQDKEQCKLYGINDYILKPYNPDELLLKIVKNKKDMDSIYTVTSATINPENMKVNNTTKINLSPILQECMGEMELLEELIRLYKQNTLEFIGKAKLHIDNGNIGALEFAIHKIKSGLAMLQTYSLHTIVEQMDQVCKNDKDIKHLKFLYGCFLEEYPIVEKAIADEVKKLNKK
ncbi:MAG: ATP-binding protein [Saonia sp.]